MSQHILQGKNPKFNVFSFFLDEVTPKILSLFKKAEGQDYYLSSFTKTNHLIIHSWAWLRSCERVTINHYSTSSTISRICRELNYRRKRAHLITC